MTDRGSLAIVGTGLMLGGDLTLAARAWIEKADVVLFHVVDAATAQWILSMNPRAEPLVLPEKARRGQGYAVMARAIIARTAPGRSVCAVFYGHPLVLTDPAVAAWKLARQQGIAVKVFPGISSTAAMMADLGLDLFKGGCQVFEATDLLLRARRPDPQMNLVLLQPAMVGNLGAYSVERARRGLALLQNYLLGFYAPTHPTTIYAGAFNARQQPLIQEIQLKELAQADPPEYVSLYLPPTELPDPDPAMVAKLGLEAHYPPPQEDRS